MLILGDAISNMAKLGRYGAIVSDPPIKIYWDHTRDYVHNSPWLGMAREMADTVIFTVSAEVADRFPTPDRIVEWHWPPHRTQIFIYGPTDGLADEIVEPWPNREAFGHGSCKPLPLLRRLVAATKGPVLDPFAGTGTTLVAAIEQGRPADGIEIDELHFATATRRTMEARPNASE